jgi:hypothetical protein
MISRAKNKKINVEKKELIEESPNIIIIQKIYRAYKSIKKFHMLKSLLQKKEPLTTSRREEEKPIFNELLYGVHILKMDENITYMGKLLIIIYR